ncbi:hypothetical protein E2C01_027603 [Portunus trituberculatus]|uniref:Uncharacterized protein n=1 Tax=Portunus trituberculatus TaxID=210409 RepID=A0A5B7EIJ5_PORTR|nr:hypothetical protein [Portunus trituberculatus]
MDITQHAQVAVWYTDLQVEEQRDPLVVLVVPGFVFIVLPVEVRVGDARVRYHDAQLCPGESRDGVGGVDPAVGVHDVCPHALHNAVDGVAEVLFLRDEQAEGHQDEHGALVV